MDEGGGRGGVNQMQAWPWGGGGGVEQEQGGKTTSGRREGAYMNIDTHSPACMLHIQIIVHARCSRRAR